MSKSLKNCASKLDIKSSPLRLNGRLLSSAALTLIICFQVDQAHSNEWIGGVSNDYFLLENWDDGLGPDGASSNINSGASVADVSLDGMSSSSFRAPGRIGASSGQTGSLDLNLNIDASGNGNSYYISVTDANGYQSGMFVGENGGAGTFNIDVDGDANIRFDALDLLIGSGPDSLGIINLFGAGKSEIFRPEGPIISPIYCHDCGSNFTVNTQGDILIGNQGGRGILNIDGAAVDWDSQGDIVVGGGAGSDGTINILARGKLSDISPRYPGDVGYVRIADGFLSVGFDGGIGTINVDGSSAGDRSEAPYALFGNGLILGAGGGSSGNLNILSQGKVHSFVEVNNTYNGVAEEQFYARVGVAGGSGSVTVSGPGAVWYQSGVSERSFGSEGTSNSSSIYIGESGNGTLTVNDSGVVRIGSYVITETQQQEEPYNRYITLADHIPDGTLVLGAEVSGDGTLNIGGASGDAAKAPGRVMAKTVRFGDGQGQINFNHTSDNYVFDEFDSQYFDGPSRPSTLSIEGAGTIDAVAGRTLINQDQLGFTGTLRPSLGILQVNGNVSNSNANILSGGTLEGVGIVGSTTNAGTIAPGQTPSGVQGVASSIGTLTIAGDYISNNGFLALDTVLGGDNSATDRLVVSGDTSGQTTVRLTNIGGAGAPTVEGIEVVSVGGASNGQFLLTGDYMFQGAPAVVAGAYAYQLYKGAVSAPANGNWYLRSALIPEDTTDPVIDPTPLYQAGAPIYEAYPQFLLGLNELPSLRQRVGQRQWSGAGIVGAEEGVTRTRRADIGSAVWGRIDGYHTSLQSRDTTTSTDFDYNSFRLQTGIDGVLVDNESGSLIASAMVHYVTGQADISSVYGDGKISSDGFGIGGALTWYGDTGFYVDAQAQATWYDSDLTSHLANTSLTDSNNGFGYALSLEGGHRFELDQNWSITPQAQLTYSSVDFSSFTDVFGADVTLRDGDSLQGRLGLAVERQNIWTNSDGSTDQSTVYGIVNLTNEFLGGTRVDLAGAQLINRQERLWGGIGLGGSYSWGGGKYSIYGEGNIETSLSNFGDSVDYKGKLGLRVKF